MNKCYIERDSYGRIIIRENGNWNPTAENIAMAMNAADMEKVLDMCGGDFSKIEPMTAEAISIKATLLLEQRGFRAEEAKKMRSRKSQQRHDAIMEEIRELACGKPFNSSSLQRAASQRIDGYPVRTWQTYAHHISRGLAKDELTYSLIEGTSVEAIYSDGHIGTQYLSRSKTGYTFSK